MPNRTGGPAGSGRQVCYDDIYMTTPPRGEEGTASMTYCLGIMTRQGLVMASDSRTNAGYDQVNVCRKMHLFCQPGKRVFALLTSGGLSLTQSVITLLRRDFDAGAGLAEAGSLYDGARVIGDQIRHVAER